MYFQTFHWFGVEFFFLPLLDGELMTVGDPLLTTVGDSSLLTSAEGSLSSLVGEPA